MTLKRYACTVHPNLRIGSHVKFYDGFYETDNVFQQALIERNDCWDWGIKEVPTAAKLAEEAAAALNAPAPVIPEMNAAVDAVMSGKPLVEGDVPGAAKVATVTDPDPTEGIRKPLDKITATDINGMRKGELVGLFAELDLKFPEYSKPTVALHKRIIRQKLGV